jgi:hypothetical protein
MRQGSGRCCPPGIRRHLTGDVDYANCLVSAVTEAGGKPAGELQIQ